MKLSLDLREKRDREGNAYLFAPLPAWNAVVFVFDDGIRGGLRRAQLVVKPYEPRPGEAQQSDTFERMWNEDVLPAARGGAPLPTPALGKDGAGPRQRSEGTNPVPAPSRPR